MSAKNGNNVSIRYNQQNRTIEKFLSDLRTTKQVSFSLESCNVCSSCCAVEAVGGKWKFEIPKFMSQADLMFNYIYSFPDKLPVLSEGVCENECIENLAFAINNLSTAKAKVVYNKNIEDIISLLQQNNAIVLSYRDSTTTGHFICIVDYKDNNFIYYDSWNNNSRNKNKGVLEKFNVNELHNCMKERYMVVTVK